MFVCHCHVVTDGEIRDAIRRGAHDVCAIAQECGAGRRCGGCIPTICNLLSESGIRSDRVTVRTLRRQMLENRSNRPLAADWEAVSSLPA